MKAMRQLYTGLLVALMLGGCVSTKQYNRDMAQIKKIVEMQTSIAEGSVVAFDLIGQRLTAVEEFMEESKSREVRSNPYKVPGNPNTLEIQQWKGVDK